MPHIRLLHVFCGLLLTVVLSWKLDITSARSLSQDDFFPQSFVKRNSWWSKKSTDNNNFKGLQQGLPEQQDTSECSVALSVYKCYADYCVPDFVSCSQNAPSDDIYQMCRIQHGICASRCFEQLQESND